jgi:hypothetical protein
MFLEAADDDDARWRTYLGTPVWMQDVKGTMPVGVVTLASNRGKSDSSVTVRNLERLRSALPLMRSAAIKILVTPTQTT